MAYYYNYHSHYSDWIMIPENELDQYDMDYLDFLGETFEESYIAFMWELKKAKNNF